jgi:mono/diheme cytochrome c family protein
VKRGVGIALFALAALAAGEAAVLGFLAWRGNARRVAADTPVARGREVAVSMGCFGCHGPGGAQPIPNPGSKSGEVPGWTGGTWMMWNKTEADVRAWIVDGHPAGREPDPGGLLKMPAYGRFVRGRDREDLIAYVLAVSQFGPPPSDAVGSGHEVAYRLGCFGCHGPEGRGLIENPGSFKGYVPAWDGPDYADLVRSPEEFRQWVRNGVCDRLKANPAAQAFLKLQAIRMPAFGEHVSDADLDALEAYVAWVRDHPRSGSSGR